jgi:hypothetical protein
MLAPNATEYECPFCHHHHTGIAPIEVLRAITKGGTRMRLLSILIDSYPNSVNMRTLEAEVYGTRGPLCSSAILSNYLSELRKSLAPYGWSIPHRSSSGHFYCLAPAIREVDRRYEAGKSA